MAFRDSIHDAYQEPFLEIKTEVWHRQAASQQYEGLGQEGPRRLETNKPTDRIKMLIDHAPAFYTLPLKQDVGDCTEKTCCFCRPQ